MITNEKGFSLLEVVVSIALLSTVLLSFFAFFIQAATYADRNNDTFDAGQTSQELLYEARNGAFTQNLTTADFNAIYGTDQPTGQPYQLRLNHQIYYPSVLIQPDTPRTSLVTVIIETAAPDGARREVFRTYGYK